MGDLKNYRQCTRCLMDTSAEISFDKCGVCNFCSDFLNKSSHIIFEDPLKKAKRLSEFVQKLKKIGKGKKYDCVVGVSGGVDSSWTLVEVKRLGLRPLAVHMDNGWNSELAQNNISNLVTELGIDLYTYVIDWEEYRSIQEAFFKSDVIDVELLYDNAMLAVCYKQANKFGVKYILSGDNQASEGMRIPSEWNWYKRDVRNIKYIAKRFGNLRLKTFPTHSTFDYIFYEYIRKIHWTPFLDFLTYNKFDALEVLEGKFGYKRYPYKHYESVFTRFYQGYILPQKFGVDKRKLHLGALVVAKTMSREDALEDLKKIAYPSEKDLNSDIQYFLKKMRWSLDDLKAYLERPQVKHDNYPNEKKLFDFLYNLFSPSFREKLKSLRLR